MSVLTTEDQWQSLASNLGTWEGNLSRYDPDGNLKARQGSVLFIYVDSPHDKLRVESNQLPNIIRMRLHRCGDQSNANKVYFQGAYFAGDGEFYDPLNGHLCFGARVIQPLSGVFLEQGLNHRDELGNIIARARLVTRFDAERLQAFSVFRERPSLLSYEVLRPTLTTSVVESDLVGTDIEATLEKLSGSWRGHVTRLRPTGSEIEASTESYVARTSVEGNEVRMEGPLGGKGIVSENRKTILFVDGARQWRLVFLGGGVTAMTSLAVPKGGEEFFVELGWLVRNDTRRRTWRRYVGSHWVESCFVEEVRECG